VSVEQQCYCGLIKQKKAGTTARADGVEVCNTCQRPVEAVVHTRPQTRILADHVTTLPELPGYTTIRSLGVVTELSSASGFTASSKGATALERAMAALRHSAEAMGADAIVDLSASAFGAGGGITGALGGDAVGVLLTGTAVEVESGRIEEVAAQESV
jgi:hypothetical protein